MKKTTIPFSDTNQFSGLIDDYLSGNKTLREFYKYTPELSSFEEVIATRSKLSVNREQLFSSLISQYDGLLNSNPSTRTLENIKLLKENNTFTITTGHQLNIFTGPLYSIYKIATVIKLATELSNKYTDKNFIPVFWMASEDHDFDEVNHINIYGKKISWETDQTGAVGRMKNKGMDSVISQLKEIIGKDSDLIDNMCNAYLHSESLAEATRKIIHGLFGDYGLVIIDGDDRELKKLFAPEIKRELLKEVSFNTVTATNELFEKNFKIQVTPREINLFYLNDGIRERIVKTEDNKFEVLNTPLIFSESELLEQLEQYPEKFSPNVVLRPLYQEKILPNLAYIGGPGELNYWFQLLNTFEEFSISYPVVMLRNCIMWIDKSTLSKFEKLGLEIPEIFHSTDSLILKILENSAQFHPSTDKQAAAIQTLYNEIAEEFTKLDASLLPAVEGEKQKALNGLKNIEDKGKRALKRKNEVIINQLNSVKEKLLPDNSLQERFDNFIPLYLNTAGKFIDEVINFTDPFSNSFIILTES